MIHVLDVEWIATDDCVMALDDLWNMYGDEQDRDEYLRDVVAGGNSVVEFVGQLTMDDPDVMQAVWDNDPNWIVTSEEGFLVKDLWGRKRVDLWRRSEVKW